MNWTEEEVDLLRRYYPSGGKIKCGDFIDRTPEAILAKAKRLKIRTTCIIRKDGWTTEDIEFLKEWYHLEGPKLCAEALDRTYKAVVTKSQDLDLKSKHKWSEEEILILRDNYKLGTKECAKLINRSTGAIKDKANSLNILATSTEWTDGEVSILLKHYEREGPVFCQNLLDRTYEAIKLHAQKLNIKYVGISNEELLNLLISKSKEVKYVTAKHMGRYTSVIIHRFGFWNKALAEAGLPLNPNNGRSAPEQSLYKELEDLYLGPMIIGDRKILKGLELDIVFPELKLAIEFNGLYWHSEKHKAKNYHIDKTKKAEAAGYRLIHVFEHEWHHKRNIVLSRIGNLLGNSTVLYARKCTIREVSSKDSKEFLEANHIQGNANGSIRLGLYLAGELVALMTFCKSRFSTKYEWELLRYCNILDTRVVGGASRLFKHFIKQVKPNTIGSYSDLKWNTGDLYKVLGFKFSHSSKPNYWYFKGLNVESRVKYQKHKLKNLLNAFDPDKTEYENMVDNGFNRFFDCGNNVYHWTEAV